MALIGTLIRNDKFKNRVNNLLSEPLLNDTSREFLLSILEFLEKTSGGLTRNQIRCLEKIEGAFNPHSKAKNMEWAEKYKQDENLRKDFIIVCHFYTTTRYYSDIASKALRDLTFIPTEKQYNALVKNHYGQSVIKMTKQQPKFKEGQLVYVSKSANIPYDTSPLSTFRGQPAIIIKTNSSPITSSKPGSKKYLILIPNIGYAIETTENQLKYRLVERKKNK